jgi:thiol:disulfide interchange protein DsbD
MKRIKYLISFALIIAIVIYIFIPSKPVVTNNQSPEQTFLVSAKLIDNNQAKLSFVIAPNYYIYKDRLQIWLLPSMESVALNKIKFPSSLLIPDINDPNKTDEVMTGKFSLDIPIDATINTINLTLQGCDGKTICYPPQKYTFNLNNSVSPGSISIKELFNDFINFYHGDSTLSNLSTPILVLLFFIAGIAISLTPCMYPLYPIALSSIIGNSVNLKRTNILMLTISYIHGIALIYVIMGCLAAYTGELFTTLTQTPIVIIISGLIWFILGLSMFDLFEIRLPHSINSYLHTKSINISGGRYTKVFLMGIMSSILLGPCVTPPLIAAIGIIVGHGDIIFGGLALYAISLGMGVPILILALVGDKMLPKSGNWMNGIKYFMGLVMIAGSIYLVAPFIYNHYIYNPSKHNEANELVIDNSLELDNTIRYSTKPVIIDFYASWCAICIEMDKKTFSDKNVQSFLANYTVIKFDLSQNTHDQMQVLKRYGLYGPPALLILNTPEPTKLLGFISSKELINKLHSASN